MSLPGVVCVDLDALVAGDLAWESRRRAWTRRPLDAAGLAPRVDLLQYLERQRSDGRRIVLVTAGGKELAEAVAAKLGIFEQVIETGGDKAGALVRAFGAKSFAFAGRGASALDVWKVAGSAIDAGAPAAIRGRIETPIEASFDGPVRGWEAVARAIRPHQWAKNLLVFVPLFTSRDLRNADAIVRLLAIAVCLGCVASAQYLLNDLIDLDSDRAHPAKRRRPIASGGLSIPAAAAMAALLLIAGLAGSYAAAGLGAALLLAVYFLVSLVYSIWLKTLALVDVFTLAGLYVFRITIGGAVSNHHVTAWLLDFSFLSFLGLGFLKRYVEIAGSERDWQAGRRGYFGNDTGIIGMMGVGSSFTAAVVLALYVYSQSATQLYENPIALWGFVPLFLLVQCRLWLFASRGQIGEDPVWHVLSDPVTWLSAALAVVVYTAAIV